MGEIVDGVILSMAIDRSESIHRSRNSRLY